MVWIITGGNWRSCQHDIYHEDHTPYDEREIEMLKEFGPRK